MSEVRLKDIQALLLWLTNESGLPQASINHIFEVAKGSVISIWNSCYNTGMTIENYKELVDVMF